MKVTTKSLLASSIIIERFRLFTRFLLNNPLITVGIITVFGAILRFYHLGDRSLWFDEAIEYSISRGSLSDIITQNIQFNSAPPLFVISLNFISKIGETEFYLRLLACVAGIAVIPAMYFLSKEFLSRRSAYFCTFLVAMETLQIHYSQEVREYSITVLLAILMLTFFYRYLREQGWKDLVLFTLVGVLAIFSQYGLALMLVALNLVLFVELFFIKTNRKNLILKWGIAQFFILCAVVLMYQISLKHHLHPGGWGKHTYLSQGYWNGSLRNFFQLIVFSTYNIIKFAFSYGKLFLFIFPLGIVAISSQRTVSMMVVFPILVTFAAACLRVYPYLSDRQDIFLTPMIYILAGFGYEIILKWDAKRFISVVLVLFLLLAGAQHIYLYYQYEGKENIKPIVNKLSSLLEDKDKIYIYSGARPAFEYYYKGKRDQLIYDNRKSRGIAEKEYLQQLLAQSGRVWMVFSHIYKNEQILAVHYVSSFRHVKLVDKAKGAFLYLVY